MATSYSHKVAVMNLLNEHVAPQASVVFLTSLGGKESVTSSVNFKVRTAVRSKGVVLKVVKNTLLNKTFTDLPQLVGPTYVAFMLDKEETDEISTPKAVVEVVNESFKDNFVIVGSVVNGSFLDSSKTVQLAKTPSKDQSLSQIAGALNAIIAKIAIGVKEVPSGLARSISEVSKSK